MFEFYVFKREKSLLKLSILSLVFASKFRHHNFWNNDRMHYFTKCIFEVHGLVSSFKLLLIQPSQFYYLIHRTTAFKGILLLLNFSESCKEFFSLFGLFLNIRNLIGHTKVKCVELKVYWFWIIPVWGFLNLAFI